MHANAGKRGGGRKEIHSGRRRTGGRERDDMTLTPLPCDSFLWTVVAVRTQALSTVAHHKGRLIGAE